MPSIASHLTTVGELDTLLSGLQTELGNLRTSYLSALAEASSDPTPFQAIGITMQAKVVEIKKMYDRIQDFFAHKQTNLGTIEQAWLAGERYTP